MGLRPLKIMWVKAEPLHPLTRGGNSRTYNMLKILKERHRITYLALADPGAEGYIKELSKEYSHEARWIKWRQFGRKGIRFYSLVILNFLFSRLPFSIQKYRSSAMEKALRACDAKGEYDLIVCDFLESSVNFPENLKTAKVLFQHNVESVIWRRYCENYKNYFIKKYLLGQWRRMMKYEARAGTIFDGVITVSKIDTKILTGQLGYTNILGDVPTGVDTGYFKALGLNKKPKSIVFSGSMDWIANEDAVRYFIKDIYPRVKTAHPDVSFTVVGRSPSDAIRYLASRDKSIIITGTVEDVRPYIDQSEIYVVPLRIGSGTRLKILEAMSIGIPVISTSIGAEGLPVRHNEDILIADMPEAFAYAIIDLLNNDSKRSALSEKGRRLVSERFRWERAAAEFENLISKVVV